MSVSRQSGDRAPIDHAVLAQITGGDAGTESRLLGIFREASAADAAALIDALRRRDAPAVVCAAHRVTGASRMAGAFELAAICDEIVRAGRCQDWDAMAARRSALELELQRVDAYLGARLGGGRQAR